MDLEELRRTVAEGLTRSTAEEIARQAGGIVAQSVKNFASGAVRRPQPAQRRALEAWAATRGIPETALPSGGDARPVSGNEDRAVLQGRSEEIEALMAYALDRQRQLTAALSRLAVVLTEVNMAGLIKAPRVDDRDEPEARFTARPRSTDEGKAQPTDAQKASRKRKTARR
jgi:hypothetical protein